MHELAIPAAAWSRSRPRPATEIEAVDAGLHAFMPEPGRRARLTAQARELAVRWPAAPGRPPLYGVPVGIKDVIRVDGLPTTAGSALPPDVLGWPGGRRGAQAAARPAR